MKGNVLEAVEQAIRDAGAVVPCKECAGRHDVRAWDAEKERLAYAFTLQQVGGIGFGSATHEDVRRLVHDMLNDSPSGCITHAPRSFL